MRSPNFIIAGERRCGTTTLANTLSRHSDIFVHPKPDGGYFIDDSVGKKASATGQAWASSHSLEDYQAWFLSAGAGSESALGEKSADYLFWHKSHPRMANFVPDAKLIVILRHPIDRAWSHYWNEVAKGRETLGFEDAIAAEAGRLEGSDFERYMFSYIARGDYGASLLQLFEYFDKANVFVTCVEKLRADPAGVLGDVCQFLDVDDSFEFPQSNKKHNVNWAVYPKPWARSGVIGALAKGYSKAARFAVKKLVRDRARRRVANVNVQRPFFIPANEARMAPATRARLSQHFQPKVAALSKLLDQDFSIWEFDN